MCPTSFPLLPAQSIGLSLSALGLYPAPAHGDTREQHRRAAFWDLVAPSWLQVVPALGQSVGLWCHKLGTKRRKSTCQAPRAVSVQNTGFLRGIWTLPYEHSLACQCLPGPLHLMHSDCALSQGGCPSHCSTLAPCAISGHSTQCDQSMWTPKGLWVSPIYVLS